MKQRLSIARAFAYPHELLLLDEPFQGLDEKLREDSMKLLKKMLIDDKNTAIIVTHQIDEAKQIADKIVYLEGRPLRIKN